MAHVKVYKYYPARWGREAIINRRLKLTTLSDINDPFEFRAIGVQDKTLREEHKKWRNSAMRKMGLISFCKNSENPVIWSHYAENYKGICLGFDVEEEILQNVQYVSNRINMTNSDFENIKSRVIPPEKSNLLTTKYSLWNYEEEVRAFYRLDDKVVHKCNGLYFVQFCEEIKLREIIIGHKYIPDKKLREKYDFNEITKEYEVRTARASFGSYKIVTQKYEKYQKKL